MIVLHYLFIQASILLFAAPFYMAYRHTHGAASAEPTLSEKLEYFFSSRQANYLVFAWAALEALVWFVIPEFLLLLVVFMRLRNKRQLLLSDILGTASGTLLAFMLPGLSHERLAKIPYITSGMIAQTEVWYHQLGLVGLLFQPFSGVPYKVFTLASHGQGFWLPAFLALALIVRISRYYIFYLIFTGLYPFLHRLVYRNYVPLFFGACMIFTLLLVRVYDSYGKSYVPDYSSGQTMARALERLGM